MRFSPHLLLAPALLAFTLVAGCATPRVPDAQVDTAARAVQQQLDAPGRLLAAAALVHAETGAFPETAFDLLKTDEARRAGAQSLRLSQLEPTASRDGFTAIFTTPAQPDGDVEQRGEIGVQVTGQGLYTATFRLTENGDGDLGRGRRDLAQSGQMVVRSAQGTLDVEIEELERALAAGRPILPLRPGAAITVAFDHTGTGARVGTATIPAE